MQEMNKPTQNQEELLIGIGDLHGHLPALESLLSQLQERESIFRDSPQEHILRPGVEIVFTGDYIDRGTQNRKLIDQLIRLRERNPYAVHELFGNHELMALASLPIASSLTSMDKEEALHHYRGTAVHGFNGGDKFVNEFSEGEESPFPEYVRQMSRGGKVGDWMRSLEALYRTTSVNKKKILFVHGGVPYKTINDRESLDAFATEFTRHMRVRSSTQITEARAKYLNSTVVDGRSPFGDRGSPQMDEESVRTLTAALGVDYIVIGHTPQENGCIAVYHQRIINVDVGMSQCYGENVPAAVVFKNDGVHGFYADGRDDLLVNTEDKQGN